eukprot:gnl/TRDRNA2_/TRDRNA2_184473_c0_seq1.p1 gnl/TRDRNA2_/TRDRNA2_184473_c0~~gnl/TRDRNA2_/TRDRNA2_184473_c0_seq1.p1  ORF type:complete len:222 (-),score=33.51 gnl/TRDRNA2_/TRDRNA2_184473_c0_seq1:203-790(-)
MSVQRPRRLPPHADHMESHHVPRHVTGESFDESMKMPAWRSGGFSTMAQSASSPLLQAALAMPKPGPHAGLVALNKDYAPLSRKFGRTETTFLPEQRTPQNPIRTDENSQEFRRFYSSRYKLRSTTQEIGHAAKRALPELDEESLKAWAHQKLLSRARVQMRRDGISSDQSKLILEEMPMILASVGQTSAMPAEY